MGAQCSHCCKCINTTGKACSKCCYDCCTKETTKSSDEIESTIPLTTTADMTIDIEAGGYPTITYDVDDDDDAGRGAASLNETPMTPIRIMIELFVTTEVLNECRGVVLNSATIPFDQQLIALTTNINSRSSALTPKPQQQLISDLFPNGAATTDDIIRFQSVLTVFNEQRMKMYQTTPIEWNETQMVLSLMVYIATMKEENVSSDESTWRFLHFLRRFCVNTEWNGMKMNEFWMKATRNGNNTDEFGQKFVERVCDQWYAASFQKVIELLPRWYHDELRRFKLYPVVLADCSVRDIVTLFMFEVDGNGDDDEKESDSGRDNVDGVFSRFEKRGGVDMECMQNIVEWKEKIVEWIRTEKVDGKMLMDRDYEDLIEGMKIALNIGNEANDSVGKSCGAILDLCRQSAVHEILEMFKQREIERASCILDLDLWTGCKMVDRPIFDLNDKEFWHCIGQWIYEDIEYNHKLSELKRLFKDYGVSGAVIRLIWNEKPGDVALIQNILENDMKRYFAADTVKKMLDAMKRWLRDTNHFDALAAAIPEDVAQLIIEFPIQNLKNAISDEQMDGDSFLENPDVFQMIVQEATGWKKSECTLLSDEMLRRISLSKQQILKNIQRLATSLATKTKGHFPQDLITKIKGQLRNNGNLESVHFNLRLNGVIDGNFRVLVMNILDDLLKSPELYGVEPGDFIPLFFDTMSRAMTMKLEDGDGQFPWLCPCCGNLNVHKVIQYRMCTDISICSLCGVTQPEAISMALKGIPMPFQRETLPINQPNDSQDRDDDELFIYQRAENKRFDLHCRAQKDSALCPILIRIGLILIDQRRYFMDSANTNTVRTVSEKILQKHVTPKQYKELLLNSAKAILTEKEPDRAEATMKVIEERLKENEDGLSDFYELFGPNGNRKKFAGILKKNKAMKPGTAAKIYNAVRDELAKIVFLAQITGIDQIHQHIVRHHLDGASMPKRLAIKKFFNDIVHFDDLSDVQLKCKRKGQLTPDHNDKRLKQLNALYMFLCHSNDTDTEEKEAKKESDAMPMTVDKFQTDVGSREKKENAYGFGVHHNYIHIQPMFSSVREEVICNPECPESHDTFIAKLLKTIEAFDDKKKMESIFVTAREYGAKHGILRNEKITKKHVMCIVLYTDLTKLSLCISLLVSTVQESGGPPSIFALVQ